MISNEMSFTILKSIIAEAVYSYVDLRKYMKICGEFLKKHFDSSVCADTIELS